MNKKLLALTLMSCFTLPVMAQQKDITRDTGVIRGLIAAENEALISSPMSGRLRSLNLKPGQQINAGQVVMRFDCEEHEAKSDMAKAELESAVDNQQAKMKMQGLSQASELEVKIAASAVEKAQANNNMFNVYLKNCRVIAPFSGKVSKINVKSYQGVQFGQPLFELISDKSLKVKANIPGKMITTVKMDQEISIHVDETGKSYAANVSAINSKIDPVSQTFEIEAKIKKVDDLVSGMSGNVTIK